MKRIKFLLMAFMAMTLSTGLVACSDDDKSSSNFEKYMKAVDSQVKSKKAKSGNKKALLLVAFGSTWENAHKTFKGIVADYESDASFKDYDVYFAFTSAICINRAAAAENTAARNFYAPNFWLHALGNAKYNEIIVQSMQVIPGEEYSRVINYIKDFANNSLGDLDDKYLSKVTLKLGTPLLNNEEDVANTARVINSLYQAQAAKGVVAFMGHGNPDSYDTYKANIRYTQLEEALQTYSPNYFVGTVDMPGNYKQDVLERMKEAGINSGTVNTYPLMSIAGDHAHNDMAGEGEEYWDASEEDSEDNSWYEFFTHKGYSVKSNLKGLLEVSQIRQLWINHTKNPVELEDYYHSMYPEE